MNIPVSVIVATKNERTRIEKCLAALKGFKEILVVDSNSDDSTKEISRASGARVENFIWNGSYPKKRQWILDNLPIKNDFVFFVDADEIVSEKLKNEIANLDFSAAGYFVKGRYVLNGRVLKHGLCNNKLALIHRRKMEFPVVSDLDIPGMGEIEGHYQPVLRPEFAGAKIGRLRHALLHEAYEDAAAWRARHLRYAAWEVEMDRRRAWPRDPSKFRAALKAVFKTLPARPAAAFAHSYILKRGFLDGPPGFDFARSRAAYYRMIADLRRR